MDEADKPGYTAEEMRVRLGVTSLRTVYRRAQRGEIAVIRQGRRTYYRDNPVTPAVTDRAASMTDSDRLLSVVRALVAEETRELTARVSVLEAEIAALRAVPPAETASADGDTHDSDTTDGDSPRRSWWRQWSWRRP